jgi:HSP20 family protein
MTIVRRPSRVGELMTLRSAVDRLFDDDFFRPTRWATAFDGPTLPLDVTTDADGLSVEAALPGIKPDDVEITVEDGTLTISGTTQEARNGEEGSYLVQEIRRGTFSRSLTLPNGLEADKADATFENGVLKLRIPKAEQAKPRQIKIAPVTESNGRRASNSPAELSAKS